MENLKQYSIQSSVRNSAQIIYSFAFRMYSLNMTKWQALISVVIPQAFVVALPSLGNNFISLLKETSLVFNIAVVDIMAQARIVGARSYRYFEVYIAVSLIYWVCCMLLERLLAKIETYVRRKERRS